MIYLESKIEYYFKLGFEIISGESFREAVVKIFLPERVKNIQMSAAGVLGETGRMKFIESFSQLQHANIRKLVQYEQTRRTDGINDGKNDEGIFGEKWIFSVLEGYY